MTRILTFSLSLYWAMFFAFNAVALLARSGHGFSSLSAGLDGGFPGLGSALAGWPLVSLVLVVMFALSAVLFLWGALSAVLLTDDFGNQFRDVSGQAISCAGLTATIAFVISTTNPSAALFQSIGLVIAGLAGTYAAIASERLTELRDRSERENSALARVMALNAAHTSLLARFSGRPSSPTGGDR